MIARGAKIHQRFEHTCDGTNISSPPLRKQYEPTREELDKYLARLKELMEDKPSGISGQLGMSPAWMSETWECFTFALWLLVGDGSGQIRRHLEMNKGRRMELKMLHFKRRLKIYRAKSNSIKEYLRGNSTYCDYNALRTSGKPCSCSCCSPYKYDRAKEKNRFLSELRRDYGKP